MDDRERMIRLIQDAVGGCARHWAALIADHLMQHGVGFFGVHIEKLNLSPRAYNALRRNGIDTVEKLRNTDEEQLKYFKYVGKTVLAEILAKRNGGTDD